MPPQTEQQASKTGLPKLKLVDLQAFRATGQRVYAPAQIWSGFSTSEMEQTDLLWEPYRAELRKRHELAGTSLPESAYWRWPCKAAAESPLRTQVYAISLGTETWDASLVQGFVMVSIDLIPSKLSNTSGQKTMYVNYIEAAPWNLAMYVGTGRTRYTGVGLNLLRVAIACSHELGSRGRLSLHSVNESDTLQFYRARNFTDLGFDPTHQYRYMELDENAALGLSEKE